MAAALASRRSGHYGAVRTFSVTPAVWGTLRADVGIRPYGGGWCVSRYPGGVGDLQGGCGHPPLRGWLVRIAAIFRFLH